MYHNIKQALSSAHLTTKEKFECIFEDDIFVGLLELDKLDEQAERARGERMRFKLANRVGA